MLRGRVIERKRFPIFMCIKVFFMHIKWNYVWLKIRDMIWGEQWLFVVMCSIYAKAQQKESFGFSFFIFRGWFFMANYALRGSIILNYFFSSWMRIEDWGLKGWWPFCNYGRFSCIESEFRRLKDFDWKILTYRYWFRPGRDCVDGRRVN